MRHSIIDARWLLRSASVAALVMVSVYTPTTASAQNAQMPADLTQELGSLVPAVKASPGCLGVEVAGTPGGKRILFAWFEDKKALQTWYYGEAHKRLMGMVGSSPAPQAMAALPEGVPILTIASFTPSAEGAATAQMQLSIELYTPLPGGAAIGERFAPPAVKVPGFRQF
jgi:hypothetical protein